MVPFDACKVPNAFGVIAECHSTGVTKNYDAAHDRLFITGKLWPTLFEIAVPGVAGGGRAAAAPAAAGETPPAARP